LGPGRQKTCRPNGFGPKVEEPLYLPKYFLGKSASNHQILSKIFFLSSPLYQLYLFIAFAYTNRDDGVTEQLSKLLPAHQRKAVSFLTNSEKNFH